VSVLTIRPYYGIVLLVFILAATVALGGSSIPVSADSCLAQLGYSSVAALQNSNSNIAVTVPVSAICSYVSSQLYALGTAYDTSTNGSVGSASTALSAASGYGYPGTFTGQLVFNLPSSMLGRKVQFNVSIYSGYPNGSNGYAGNGVQIATTNELQVLNFNNYQYNNSGYQYGTCYQNPYCLYPGYYNGNYYTTCQPTGNGNTVQCSGYLYQPLTGCVELAVPVNNGYWFESPVFQYYTLRNLPSSYASGWRWITVTGQLYQGYNTASTGVSCPGNYINVSALSP